ncbi:MAG TPA: hypothetical protein ENL23_05650 [Candidatus Acetothermia bacterium]|nr:hypothetical protein [Candidatus Acetothermia bacterium]
MRKKGALICIIILATAAVIGYGYTRSDFMFLSEIEPGMTGVGKTIVSGDTISEFNVSVIGVIDEPGDASDFIVVRVSGEAIGRSGGIAQGMSGSPVYIDGKLIGALSRAAAWSKELTPIGLVTPIEQMLRIIDSMHDTSVSSRPNSDAILAGVRLCDRAAPPSSAELSSLPNTIFAYSVSSPLIVSGLSGRSLTTLMDGYSATQPTGLVGDFLPTSVAPRFTGLSSFGLRLNPVSGGATNETESELDLVPGSGIGVALASGDVTIGALGTVTYRDNDLVVAFGHRFISNGAADFPLTSVRIYDTMRAYDASFKLGTIGETLGTILEDRASGIGGAIGRQASMIGLGIGVLDLDTQATKNFQIQLVDEPRIMPNLILATGLNAIDETLDRIGQGTVEVNYQIIGDGMPAPLQRRDLFLSTQDIAIYPPWQLAGIVNFLQFNDFTDPQITRITATMQITHKIKAMHINHLELDKDSYAPGETIHYTVDLQTYQGGTQTVEGDIIVPDWLFADDITVRAYGGPRLLEEGEAPLEFQSLDDVIQAIEDLPTYDTLTVELFAWDYASPNGMQGVDKVRTDVTGYFLYDTREVTVPLIFLDNAG